MSLSVINDIGNGRRMTGKNEMDQSIFSMKIK